MDHRRSSRKWGSNCWGVALYPMLLLISAKLPSMVSVLYAADTPADLYHCLGTEYDCA